MKKTGWKPIIIVFAVGMILAHCIIFWNLHRAILSGYGDFAAFYTAGKLVQNHQGSKLYDRAAQWKIQQEFAPDVANRQGPLPYIHPPFEALLFDIFAYLSYPAAWIAWTILQLVLLFSIPFLLHRCATTPSVISPGWQGIFSLAFFPVAFTLIQGQDAVLLLFFFSLALVLLFRKQNFLAGICLGLAVIKFQVVLPIVLILILRRRWRVIAGFIAAAAGLTLASGFLVGWTILANYPKYLLNLDHNAGMGVSIPSQMPNLRGLTTVLLASVPGALHSVWYFGMCVGFIVLGVLVGARFWNDRNPGPNAVLAEFSLAITIAIAAAYYSYGYELILLLIPLAMHRTLLAGTPPEAWPRRLLMGSAGLLLFTPLSWLLFDLRQFYWMVFVLVLFATSLIGILRNFEGRKRLQPTNVEAVF